MALSDRAILQACSILELLMSDSTLTSRNVIDHVARRTGVLPGHIVSERRDQATAVAKHLAAYVLVKRFGLSTPQAGKTLHKDHSSVISSVNRVEKYLERSKALTDGKDLPVPESPTYALFRVSPPDTSTQGVHLEQIGPRYKLMGPVLYRDPDGNVYFASGESTVQGFHRLPLPSRVRVLLDLETLTFVLDNDELPSE